MLNPTKLVNTFSAHYFSPQISIFELLWVNVPVWPKDYFGTVRHDERLQIYTNFTGGAEAGVLASNFFCCEIFQSGT